MEMQKLGQQVLDALEEIKLEIRKGNFELLKNFSSRDVDIIDEHKLEKYCKDDYSSSFQLGT